MGNSRVPSVALISSALEAHSSRKHPTVRRSLFALPGVVFSVLPFGACPACLPVYGGILSALGLGFLVSFRYLLPLTALFLSIALVALAYRAGSRHGYRPFAVGIIAAALILVAKFSLEQDALAYGGIAILVVASLWNSWPSNNRIKTCPKCAPSGSELVHLSALEK